MIHSLIVFILALLFASFSFGKGGVGISPYDIENPDASLTSGSAPEQEVLSRAVSLTGAEGDCSGTWLEPGVVIGAHHCSPLVETGPDQQPVLRIGGIRTPVLFSSASDSSADAALLRASDVLVLGVDPSPLATLNLPQSALALPAPDSVGLPAGVRLLIAGYGSNSLAFDREGTIITDFSLLGKRPLAAAWVESAQTRSARDYILFTAARKTRTLLDCAAGQNFWSLRGPDSCRFQTSVNPTDRQDPAIQSGDSGGPALRRKGDQWELAGVIHGGKLEMINPDAVQLQVRLGEETQALSVPTTPDFWKLYDGNSRTSFERIGKLNTTIYAKAFGTLGLDQNAPLQSPVRIEHQQFGFLISTQVNLASPEINAALRKQVGKARQTVTSKGTPP
jgi:hypothetical protein